VFADLRYLRRQAKALLRCRGEGVEELVEVCVEEAAMVTQFSGMPLSDLLSSETLSDERNINILCQTFRIVKDLQKKAKYAHNDIGPENVCVAICGQELRVTLTDFWLACKVGKRVCDLPSDHHRRLLRERHPWVCPEVLRGAASGPGTEAFSLAVLTQTLRLRHGQYPRHLRRWVIKAIKRRPNERPPLKKTLKLLVVIHKKIQRCPRKP